MEIAVRTDRVKLGAGLEPGCGLTGLVQNIEYHGQKVQVALAAPGIDEFSVQVPETAFFAAPLNRGRRRAADLDAAGRPHPRSLALGLIQNLKPFD